MNDARLKEIEEAKWNGTISLDDCSDLIAALRESQAETERQSTRADALLKLTEEFQADLRETRAREAKLREALESCAGVIDTDFIKSETEDGEVEYWINDQTIQHIVEEALEGTKP